MIFKLENPLEFGRYLLAPRKKLVLILSTMRSGSTLLKALLGAAPDVSHLSEVKFHHLQMNRYAFYNRFHALAPEPIVVLKHPAWFTDPINRFAVPKLPCVRLLCLVRDCYPTLLSLKSMPDSDTRSDEYLVEYWVKMTRRILNKLEQHESRSRLVRYEDLVEHTIETSLELFRFVGSTMKTGVATYSRPDGGAWTWGSDDGGDKIRSREIRATHSHADDPALLECINRHPEVAALRERLDYPASVQTAVKDPRVRSTSDRNH